jgi:L-asparagine transporter-like permease
MKNDNVVKHKVKHQENEEIRKGNGEGIQWWQLTLIGIGSIIGAGFFLGTGLSIQTAGPSMLLAYLAGGVIAFLTFSALAEMSVNDPQPGSFRTYAGKAFGPGIGFVSGWMYWLAGVLIMSSEVTALAIFTKFWFPHVPLWVFSIVYAAAGLGINLLGVRNFGTIESFFAIVKLSTLIVFIVFGAMILTGVIPPSANLTINRPAFLLQGSVFFPHGFIGLWSAMIFALFSYGGIEIMGVTANELKNKNDVTKAGTVLLLALVFLYVTALFFVIIMADWSKINESESPFVTALSAFNLPYLSTIFNLIIISAAFSTMVGSLFSITRVMLSLANDGDAPRMFAQINKRGVPAKALFLGSSGLALCIVLSFLLPNTVYEYVTTAAGVMLIVNWVIIMSSQVKNHSNYIKSGDRLASQMPGTPYSSYFGIALIVVSVSGALFRPNERVGFLVSLGIIGIIFVSYYLRSHSVLVPAKEKRKERS